MSFSCLRWRNNSVRLLMGIIVMSGMSRACLLLEAGRYMVEIPCCLAVSAMVMAERMGRRLPSSANSPANSAPSRAV